jgi:hypothetical protein
VPDVTVTLTVQCYNLVNFSGTNIKGYFIFKFTLKYLSFSMLWVSHLWLVTLHIVYAAEKASLNKLINKILTSIIIRGFRSSSFDAASLNNLKYMR